MQYATDVNNLSFLARLEFLCETGCVPHYFQNKEITFILIFHPQSQTQIFNYQILEPRRAFFSCVFADFFNCYFFVLLRFGRSYTISSIFILAVGNTPYGKRHNSGTQSPF